MMGGYSGYGLGSMMWGGGTWLMMIGGIFFLLLILAGIVIVVWAASQSGKSGGGARLSETPLDVLKRRYANGEIDKKQFEDMKKDLM